MNRRVTFMLVQVNCCFKRTTGINQLGTNVIGDISDPNRVIPSLETN